MSTALHQRPIGSPTDHGGAPARRAVIRWAWRLYRREWRQQLLVLALVAVAMAATSAGLAMATNVPSYQDANGSQSPVRSPPWISGRRTPVVPTDIRWCGSSPVDTRPVRTRSR